jgi:hypothetical protein
MLVIGYFLCEELTPKSNDDNDDDGDYMLGLNFMYKTKINFSNTVKFC